VPKPGNGSPVNTIVAGEEGYTKADGSQRKIQMSQVVYEALRAQEKLTRHKSKHALCNGNAKPKSARNSYCEAFQRRAGTFQSARTDS
jgi:integrase